MALHFFSPSAGVATRGHGFFDVASTSGHLTVLVIFILLLAIQSCNRQERRDAGLAGITVMVDSALNRKTADSIFLIAEEYRRRGNSDSALVFYMDALSIRERVKEAPLIRLKNAMEIAEIYRLDFKYDVADGYFEKARLLADSNAAPPDLLIDLYFKSADCKENMRDFVSAASMLRRNLSLVQQFFPDDKTRLSLTFRLLANNSYYAKDHRQAEKYLQQSLDLVSPNDSLVRARLIGSMALNYSVSGQNEKALRLFDKAIMNIPRGYENYSNEQAKIYLQKAAALEAIGDRDSSLFYFKRNLAIRRQVFGEKDINMFGANYAIGQFYFRANSLDSSLHYFQQALVSLVKEFNDLQFTSNPTPAATECDDNAVVALVGKANALERMAELDTARVKGLLELSLRTYHLADSVLAVHWSHLQYDDPKLEQMKLEYVPYGKVVSVAFRLYELEKTDHYAAAALRAMERARAMLLQNSISKAEAYSTLGIDPSLRLSENALARQRVGILQQLDRKDLNESASDSLHQELLSINNQFSRLQAQLNPNYVRAKYTAIATDLSSIRAYLEENEAILLEYLWGDSTVQLMAISADTAVTLSIPITIELTGAFRSFAEQVHAHPGDGYHKDRFDQFVSSSFLIYSSLVKPVEIIARGENRNLIISSDGPLSTFPFEALITRIPEGNEVNYHLPYLIHSCTISYAYSSNILLQHGTHEREGSKLLALGFAGSNGSDGLRSGMVDLPGTEQEIRAIEEVMKNSVNNYLLENEATESAFKQRVKDYDIAHLALHGEGDTLNSLMSKLVFRKESEKKEDGDLFAHELYDLDLSRLDLAVLSACETGIGKVETGEGVMSIARGFAYAGCPSLVISLWKVDDGTSATLMSGFYKYLSDGTKLNESLSMAKTAYINESNEFKSHPFYWAAFLQVGDTRSLDVGSTWKIWWILIPFISVVLLIFFARPRKVG